MKSLLFVASNVMPYFTSSGSSVLMNAIISCFSKIGFKVYVYPIQLNPDYYKDGDIKQYVDYLEDNGMDVIVNDKHLMHRKKSNLDIIKRIINTTEHDLFEVNLREDQKIRHFIKERNITHVAGYSHKGVYAIKDLEGVEKIGCVVDLPHLLYERQRKVLGKSLGLKKIITYFSWRAGKHYPKIALSALSKMDIIIENAYQHAEELREMNFQNVHYIPHPLPEQELSAFDRSKKREQLIVLIAGSLKGVASRLGFHFFLNDLLPQFKNSADSNILEKVSFRVVGHGSISPTLKNQLEEEQLVDFHGYAENIEEEYLNADLLLVNIPVSHGFRTRIAEAFSYGMCVIAHCANAEGMPEIQDGYNAFTGRDKREMSDKLIQLLENAALRKVFGQNAKKTFEEKISEKGAVEKLSAILQMDKIKTN